MTNKTLLWNVVDKLPIWGITSTNGDGELAQTTFEAVDGSRFGGFFVKFVPLGNCWGVERFIVCGCGRRDAFELVLVVASGVWIRWDKR